jgi:hypothetical protein
LRRSAGRHDARLDDGRSVAFDLKDYAHVDHGYAATIHKAQGMTVDRTHVLATPGLDAHGSYVALSRHRDGVELHYGRDDFADRRELVDRLGGIGPRIWRRIMRADPHKPRPRRRGLCRTAGITVSERIAEMVRNLMPEKLCDAFDDLVSPGKLGRLGRSRTEKTGGTGTVAIRTDPTAGAREAARAFRRAAAARSHCRTGGICATSDKAAWAVRRAEAGQGRGA